MEIRILGPIEVVVGAKTVALSRTDELRVLTLLAARPNESVPSSELCRAIWPELEHGRARARLVKSIGRVRELLGSAGKPRAAQRWLTTEGGGYALRVSTQELDARDFRERHESGLNSLQHGEYAQAAAELRAGLRRWRGRAFGDLAEEAFVCSEAARLEETRLSALEARIDADLGLGRHPELCPELEELIEQHPRRAQLHRQLMVALYRSDRQADALRVAARFRQGAEAGDAEPAPELAQLEHDILLQKPHLDRASERRPVGSFRSVSPDEIRNRVHGPEPDLDVASATTFVGRRAERRWLLDRLDDAVHGTPQVVLLRGEAGMGKSRLARELVEEAGDRGIATSIGRFREQQSAPFDAFVGDFFQRLADAARDDPGLSTSIELFDGFAPFAQDRGSGPPATDAERLTAVRQAFTHLITREPFLLLVDDVQWADAASFELLVNLVRLAADASLRKPVYLLAVLIARDAVGVPERPELDLVRREAITSSLTLHGLTDLEVSRLATAVGAREVPRAVISEMTRVTRGNPLFAVALVKQFAAGSDGRRDELVMSNGPLPSEVQALIGTRVSGLSPACQAMLTTVAVLGKGCSFAELQTASGIERRVLGELVDEAEQAEVLIEWHDGYDFAHPLYERAVLSRLSVRRRQEAHARVADVLIKDAAAAISPMAIAQHLLDAGEWADPALALEYCARAGDRASEALAPEDTARYYEGALRAAARLQQVPHDAIVDFALRASVARLQNSEAALALADADAALASMGVDPPAESLATVWNMRLRAEIRANSPGQFADIGPLALLAPELEARAPRLAACVHGSLANYYANAAFDVDKAREACVRAIELGNRHDEQSACADGWGVLAVTQWIRLELADAVESLRAESYHGARSGERHKLGHSMSLLPLTLVWLGRFDEAEAAIEEARRSAREMSFLLREGFVAIAEAMLAAVRGMFIESDAAVEDAIEIGRLTDAQLPTALTSQLLAWTRSLRGDDDGADAVLEQWAPPGAPTDRATFAWLLRQHRAAIAGRPPDRSEIEALWTRLSGSPGFSVDATAALVVELAAEIGAGDLAAQAGEFLATLANRGQVFTTTMGLFIPRVLGIAAAAAGDPTDARAQLERSITTASALRAHAEVAASEYALASVLATVSDTAGSLSVLESAHRAAGALGLFPLVLRCEALAESLGTSLGDRTGVAHAGGRSAQGSATSAPTEMAVVMFTDIADSVALTEQLGDWVFHDRARLLQASLRRTIRSLTGRPVEGIKLGDGILAEFRAAEPAVRCAVACSKIAQEAGLPLHIGVHAGDVIRDQGDIFGGTVNTAARICTRAPAGHVLVSQTIRDLARTSSAFTFRWFGDQPLKGIANPVPLFAVETSA